MRQPFVGYFPPTDSEVEYLFDQALVVLDTNALLNLYRYRRDVRESFLGMLERLRGRLWLPHRVAFEFHKQRVSVIRDQDRAIDKILKALGDIQSGVINTLGALSRNAIVDIEPIVSSVSDAITTEIRKLEEEREQLQGSAGITPQHDELLHRIAELYEGRVGVELSTDEMADLLQEGERRYADEVPPGYRDSKKSGNDKYGDFIIWKQMVREASGQGRGILFLTDDNKEDWWWISEGEVLGPRPELRAEFAQESGQLFYCYRPHYFLDLLKKRGDESVSDELVREVQETSDRKATDGPAVLVADPSQTLKLVMERAKDHQRGLIEQLSDVRARIDASTRRLASLEDRIVHDKPLQGIAHLRARTNELLRKEADFFAKAATEGSEGQREDLIKKALDARKHRQAIELSIGSGAGLPGRLEHDRDVANQLRFELGGLRAQEESLLRMMWLPVEGRDMQEGD